MSSINKVILIGNLGKDPELRKFANGTSVTTLSVATSERWKDKETGENKELTMWHNVSVTGATADNCCKYLVKGSKIYAEGSLKQTQWSDAEGNKKYGVQVNAREIRFLSAKGDNNTSSYPKPPKVETYDEDIPF